MSEVDEVNKSLAISTILAVVGDVIYYVKKH